MKTEHTPEPWATNGTRIESEHNHGWANDGWIIGGMDGPDAEANARRIVACVNACAGLSTGFLEQIDSIQSALTGQLVVTEVLENQRDELLAALEKIKMHSVSLADAQVVALEAIASVKEK